MRGYKGAVRPTLRAIGRTLRELPPRAPRFRCEGLAIVEAVLFAVGTTVLAAAAIVVRLLTVSAPTRLTEPAFDESTLVLIQS